MKSLFIRALVVTVAFTALSFAVSSRVIAQSATHPFKAGDRVEVDTMYSPDPSKSVSWRSGVIVSLYDPEDRFGGYILKMDDDGHQFRNRFVDTKWIRPA